MKNVTLHTDVWEIPPISLSWGGNYPPQVDERGKHAFEEIQRFKFTYPLTIKTSRLFRPYSFIYLYMYIFAFGPYVCWTKVERLIKHSCSLTDGLVLAERPADSVISLHKSSGYIWIRSFLKRRESTLHLLQHCNKRPWMIRRCNFCNRLCSAGGEQLVCDCHSTGQ